MLKTAHLTIHLCASKISILAILAKMETSMSTKTIASTKAQNNFGQILDDVVQNHTRYVVKRHNKAQVIILSLSDFEKMLVDSQEQQRVQHLIRELKPVYNVGETV